MGVKEKFLSVFGGSKVILAMIHLKGNTPQEVFERAKREIGLYINGGADAIVIENYFGSEDDTEAVLAYLEREHSGIVYGVNMLDNDARGFAAATKYHAKFLQLDSVAGHLIPEDDAVFETLLSKWRAETDALVLGGVRFKYQPYNSGRSLEEDLRIGMERCDAIVVTGNGTGMTTDMEKISTFRQIIGDFPLVVGAGVTPETSAERLEICEAAIVGSYFKDTYCDNGEVDPAHVAELMKAVAKIR